MILLSPLLSPRKFKQNSTRLSMNTRRSYERSSTTCFRRLAKHSASTKSNDKDHVRNQPNEVRAPLQVSSRPNSPRRSAARDHLNTVEMAMVQLALPLCSCAWNRCKKPCMAGEDVNPEALVRLNSEARRALTILRRREGATKRTSTALIRSPTSRRGPTPHEANRQHAPRP